jgi:serine/threonine protein kinase
MSSPRTLALGPNGPSPSLGVGKPVYPELPKPGVVIGNLELIRQIGTGGMGRVFECKHRSLQRLFAIKFLEPESIFDAEQQSRFQQEVKALGRLIHSNILHATDAGIWNGFPYLVTELLDGRDLGQHMQESGPFPYEVAVSIVVEAALGLQFAHQHGFIHRDIKPSNLFLHKGCTLKVIDFGLVREHSKTSFQTLTGAFLGSVDYLSPEQANNPSQVDRRSDIYSLGCTLIHLLSGEPPFPDRLYPSIVSKLKGHMMDVPPWLDSPDREIPDGLARVIRSMVAKHPNDRPLSCDSLVSMLQAYHREGSSIVSLSKTFTKQRTSRHAFLRMASIAVLVGGFLGGAIVMSMDSSFASRVTPATKNGSSTMIRDDEKPTTSGLRSRVPNGQGTINARNVGLPTKAFVNPQSINPGDGDHR